MSSPHIFSENCFAISGLPISVQEWLSHFQNVSWTAIEKGADVNFSVNSGNGTMPHAMPHDLDTNGPSTGETVKTE
jgi:hypothetical protein